jgi:hypothetical protein
VNDLGLKQSIIRTLGYFASGNLADNACSLFETLGYRVDKRTSLDKPTAQSFFDSFAQERAFNPETALLRDWQFVDLLFQLTRDEITGSNQLRIAFGDTSRVDNTIIESYLFFAIALSGSTYTRTQLAAITREVNKLFPMPVMLVFKHGQTLTLSIINRRLHKRDESKDVLEKVTLIKDINFASPHRAHIEILFDLSLQQLFKAYKFTNFVELHKAWQKTLDSSELNKRFFREVSNWYFWATQNVVFPAGAETDEEVRNATSMIRLITRLIFVWFLKEKSLDDKPLVPDELFQLSQIEHLIHFDDLNSSTYYKAILQNLFFATLNQEMNTLDKPDNRKFRHKGNLGQRDQYYMVHNVYRYKALFKQPDEALKLFESVPFLNGGLFECLDHPDPNNPKQAIRVDAFSDREDNVLSVPNYLFFSEKQDVDLNEIYGTKNKRFEVRGLIDIFNRYKFTIAENTPLEEEIALDPELLGKVFENLLAAYNSETRVTARKQTGSFYTPREVVDYMVDESLLIYLATQMMESDLVNEADRANLEQHLRQLLDYKSKLNPFEKRPNETIILICAIDQLKVLDPAVGSGAFPMGILQKLVFILGKLDPKNKEWKKRQVTKAEELSDSTVRERVIEEIKQAFERNELDYGRKLYLIENCIYGVDIQPIAVQIAKLRFFISLIVEQCVNEGLPNRGILPLPNLETKLISANTLMSIDRLGEMSLGAYAVQEKEQKLADLRRRIFTARTQATKQKYREEDRLLRKEIVDLLKREGWSDRTAIQIAQWNPYNQNSSASFFDPEWMFGLRAGFDVVIGNPPYVRQEQIKHLKDQFKQQYDCFTGTADLYVYFYERGLKLLREHGVLTYISSNKYFRAAYGQKLRQFLTTHSRIHQVIDFGDAPVFAAIAYPTIVVTEKAEPTEQIFRALNWEMGQPIEQFKGVVESKSFLMPQKELKAESWQFADDTVLRLMERLRKAGTPLDEYVNKRFYYGIKTGLNEAFVVDRATYDRLITEHPSSEKVLKPFLRGRDIKRWKANFQEQYLIKLESSENKNHPWSGKSQKDAEQIFAKTYPAIYNWIMLFREKLIARDDQGKFFWELRSCVYWDEFEKPKIIIPAIERTSSYAIDLDNHFSNDKTTICCTDSSKYILGLLNSRLLFWFIQQTASAKQGGFYEFKPMYVSKLPIVKAENPLLIGNFVDYIFCIYQQNVTFSQDKLMLEYFEQIINGLVYELYFPKDLQAQDLTFAEPLQSENLQKLDDIQGDRLNALRAIFQRLYATDHLIRQNLVALDTLPIIRMIEGRA